MFLSSLFIHSKQLIVLHRSESHAQYSRVYIYTLICKLCGLQDNLKHIHEMNKPYASSVFGITKFSDLTQKEFQGKSCNIK